MTSLAHRYLLGEELLITELTAAIDLMTTNSLCVAVGWHCVAFYPLHISYQQLFLFVLFETKPLPCVKRVSRSHAAALLTFVRM